MAHAMDDDEAPPDLVDSSGAGVTATELHDSARKVPITIVTGKTKGTLPAVRFADPQEDRCPPERLVVPRSNLCRESILLTQRLSPEFGDSASIEKSITISNPTATASTTDWLTLPNGCICCSVRDAGAAALESLITRRPGAIDYILLETTGLADPGNIAPMFWLDDGLGASIYLDGIVAVVDAKNVLHSLDEPAAEEHAHGEATHTHPGPIMTVAHLQISHADVILLNKVDLVTPSEREAITHRIRSINALARLIPTTHSAIPDLSGTVLDLHAYNATQTTLPNFSEKGHSHLDPTISTISVALPPFDPQKLYLLQNWLQSLLWDDGDSDGKREKRYEIHRLKGYVPITDGTARVVQGVREVFEIIDVDEAEGARPDDGKIVLIGRGLANIDLGGL